MSQPSTVTVNQPPVAGWTRDINGREKLWTAVVTCPTCGGLDGPGDNPPSCLDCLGDGEVPEVRFIPHEAHER